MKYTPAERIAIYYGIIEGITEYAGQDWLVCVSLHDRANVPYGYLNQEFPEWYKQRPLRSWLFGRSGSPWWDRSTWGNRKRIEALIRAINLAKKSQK